MKAQPVREDDMTTGDKLRHEYKLEEGGYKVRLEATDDYDPGIMLFPCVGVAVYVNPNDIRRDGVQAADDKAQALTARIADELKTQLATPFTDPGKEVQLAYGEEEKPGKSRMHGETKFFRQLHIGSHARSPFQQGREALEAVFDRTMDIVGKNTLIDRVVEPKATHAENAKTDRTTGARQHGD